MSKGWDQGNRKPFLLLSNLEVSPYKPGWLLQLAFFEAS